MHARAGQPGTYLQATTAAETSNEHETCDGPRLSAAALTSDNGLLQQRSRDTKQGADAEASFILAALPTHLQGKADAQFSERHPC